MARLFSVLLVVCFFHLTARSQTVIHINAGSRASYGTYQNLMVGINGQCVYYFLEVTGGLKDSLVFNITKAQLDSIFLKAEQVGFFQLKNKYDRGVADGAGILIAINRSGTKKTVELLNTDIPQVNELIVFINHILEAQKIRIYYGQK